ncbi:MAG: SDR family NAD(P)-dependent oxidoreductase [Myxococcota bacterium]
MKDFRDKIAVITGGGTGMGRELAVQLAAAGCHVAICDVSEEAMAQTRALCEQKGTDGVRVSTSLCDVADEGQMIQFRDDVMREHGAKHVNLVFNNAGIGAAVSFVADEREEWERTFDVCWKGVYYGSRVFVPLLVAADEAHLVNTSSVNGFWASLGPLTSHSAYSAAKFAVKGFTEALVNDFRVHAPHVKVSVVMPGHIGTSIVINSGRILGRDPKELPESELESMRERMADAGVELGEVTNDQIRQFMQQRAESFRDDAPMSAAEAAAIILQGVREERWRILVGDDAHVLDRLVREAPEEAYEPGFMERFQSETPWALDQFGDSDPTS